MEQIETVLLILIIANVLFSMKGFKDGLFFNKYKFQIGAIKSGDKIRMVSSAFLHADWMHLGFNMYALYIFGGNVIRVFDNVHFLLIYTVSIVTGSMYSFFRHKTNDYYSAIGASGAVSGIVFSAILLFPNSRIGIFPIPIRMPAYVFGILYLLYSIYGMKKQLGNVGHAAHLGGAIGGFVLTLILKPGVFSNNPIIVSTMGLIIGGLLLFGDKLNK